MKKLSQMTNVQYHIRKHYWADLAINIKQEKTQLFSTS